MFGGYGNSETYFNDLFMFDPELNEWKKIGKYKDFRPNARHSHSAVVYGKYMYVFGGATKIGKIPTILSDLFRYSFEEGKWELITTSGEILPRWGHSAVVYGNSMFIFGGFGDSHFMSDLLELNLGK